MDLIKAFWADFKSAFSKIQSLSPQVKKEKNIIYGCIGVLILVLFLIAHSKGTNDLTNWISAMANVVMAGAAVVGVWFAKNWKREATKNKAVGVCEDIILDSIPKIKPNDFELNVIQLMKFNFLRMQSFPPLQHKDIDILLKSSEYTEKLYNAVLLTSNEFRRRHINLNILSWDFKEPFKIDLLNIVEINQNSTSLLNNIRSIIRFILESVGFEYVYDKFEGGFNENHSIDLPMYIDALIRYIDKLLISYEKAIDLHEKLPLKGANIFDIFENIK